MYAVPIPRSSSVSHSRSHPPATSQSTLSPPSTDEEDEYRPLQNYGNERTLLLYDEESHERNVSSLQRGASPFGAGLRFARQPQPPAEDDRWSRSKSPMPVEPFAHDDADDSAPCQSVVDNQHANPKQTRQEVLCDEQGMQQKVQRRRSASQPQKSLEPRHHVKDFESKQNGVCEFYSAKTVPHGHDPPPRVSQFSFPSAPRREYNVGMGKLDGDDIEGAVSCFLAALELMKQGGEEALDPSLLADVMLALGNAHGRLSNFSEARSYYQWSHDLLLRHESNDHTALAVPLLNLGILYCMQRDFTGAITVLRRAAKGLENVYNEQRTLLADVCHNLGVAMEGMGGCLTQALHYYAKSIRIREQLMGYSNNTSNRSRLSNSVSHHGTSSRAQRDLVQQTVTGTGLSSHDEEGLALSMENVAMCWRAQGNTVEALKLIRKVLNMRRISGKSTYAYAHTMLCAGIIAFDLRKFSYAHAHLHTARDLFLEQVGAQHPITRQAERLVEQIDAVVAAPAPHRQSELQEDTTRVNKKNSTTRTPAARPSSSQHSVDTSSHTRPPKKHRQRAPTEWKNHQSIPHRSSRSVSPPQAPLRTPSKVKPHFTLPATPKGGTTPSRGARGNVLAPVPTRLPPPALYSEVSHTLGTIPMGSHRLSNQPKNASTVERTGTVGKHSIQKTKQYIELDACTQRIKTHRSASAGTRI